MSIPIKFPGPTSQQTEIENPKTSMIKTSKHPDQLSSSQKVHQFQLASTQVAELHGRSRKIYSELFIKGLDSTDKQNLFNLAKCPCCGFPAEGQDFSFFCISSDLSQLGSSFPLFFKFSKYLTVALFCVFCVAGVPCLVNNSVQSQYTEWTREKNANVLTPANFGENMKVDFWQPILHVCVCGVMVFFYAWILRNIKEHAVDFDTNVTTPSDFTVMVKNLPTDYTKTELAKHIEDNFQLRDFKIVNIVSTYDVREYVECVKELEDYKAQYLLVKNYEERYKKPLIIRKSCKEFEVEGPEGCLTRISQLEIDKQKLSTQMKSEKMASVAFVSFSSQTCARLVAYAWERTWLQIAFDRLCCGFVSKRYWFLGNYVHGEIAPDHTDVNWENLAVGWKEKWTWRTITVSVALLTLIAATGIMAGTSQWKADVNKNKNNESADSIRSATIIPTIVTVLTNFTVARLIRIFSDKEKYSTWTDYNRTVLNKLVIFYLLNNIGIPMFVYSNADEEWFSPGGLAYTVFWLEIFNSCASPVIYLINPKNQFKRLSRYLLKRSEDKGDVRVSQKVANQVFEGPEVDLADQFANLIKTFTMSLFYAPIVPIGVLIGIFGLVFETLVFKYMLVKVHSRPKWYNSDLVIKAAEWMRWSLFMYSLGILVFYQKLAASLWPLELFFFVSMAVYVFTPISTLCLCCFKDKTLDIIERIFEGDSTQNSYFYMLPKFFSDFERENPATSEEGVKKWEKFVRDKTESSYVDTEFSLGERVEVKRGEGNKGDVRLRVYPETGSFGRSQLVENIFQVIPESVDEGKNKDPNANLYPELDSTVIGSRNQANHAKSNFNKLNK